MGVTQAFLGESAGDLLDAELSRRNLDYCLWIETDGLFPYYGAEFLRLAAVRLERPELAEAAVRLRAVYTLMTRLWARVGGMRAPQAHLRLADRRTRQAMAALLLEMQREDEAAFALLAG